MNAKQPEPAMTINGQILTRAENMTVRAALEAFAASLTADGLGDDPHGRAMTEAYLANIELIRRRIAGATP